MTLRTATKIEKILIDAGHKWLADLLMKDFRAKETALNVYDGQVRDMLRELMALRERDEKLKRIELRQTP